MTIAPYGSWPSPISVEQLTEASVVLESPVLDGDDLYWLERRAAEGGRISLWRRDASGSVSEVTRAPTCVRTRVHEYGGGAYAVAAGVVVYSDFAGGQVIRRDPDGSLTALTPPGPWRYADLRLHPDRDLVLAVREDHRGVEDGDVAEPRNTIVALTLSRLNEDGGRIVCQGSDFYAAPTLSADGRLAWVEWSHPDMPWDATRILVGGYTGSGVDDVQTVTGSHGSPESALHPGWTPDGVLIFLSDRTGWWNFYVWRAGVVQEVHRSEAEFCDPPWYLGQRPYAVFDEDHVLCRWQRDGWSRLGRLTLSTGVLEELDGPVAGYEGLSVRNHTASLVRSRQTASPELVLIDLLHSDWQQVRVARVDPPTSAISVAQDVSWDSDGERVYGWYYPPANPDCSAPDGELPPLLTLSHGGPTAFSPPAFNLALQFWTSRGLAVLDVNYRGSSGYGRGYRDRLRGAWGDIDVADCVSGALALAERGLVDRRRLAIRGGSAGGYTTLRALTSTDTFAAGISWYGVADLELLARDTHKFESRYLDGLIGPYPQEAQCYRERSPIHHVDALSAPILLLQGSDDAVVPPNQAEKMAEAARRKGLPVALLMFPGEGHGFRRADSTRRALQAELCFLGRVFGFTPADQLPPLEIENL